MIGRPPHRSCTTSRSTPSALELVALPLSIHTSANWTPGRGPATSAIRATSTKSPANFPDLTPILMSHAGYPWVLEACLVAWKHPESISSSRGPSPEILPHRSRGRMGNR